MEALTRVHHAGVHYLWRHHTGGVHRVDLLRVDVSRALNDLGGWLLEFTRSGGDPLLLGAVVGAWRCRSPEVRYRQQWHEVWMITIYTYLLNPLADSFLVAW